MKIKAAFWHEKFEKGGISLSANIPVIANNFDGSVHVPIAQSLQRYLERFPIRVQCILYHLRSMHDCESAKKCIQLFKCEHDERTLMKQAESNFSNSKNCGTCLKCFSIE